jgi:hypothetical protein
MIEARKRAAPECDIAGKPLARGTLKGRAGQVRGAPVLQGCAALKLEIFIRR